MPATKLAQNMRRKACDPIKELILGRAAVYDLNNGDMAKVLGVSVTTYVKRKSGSLSEWTWGEIVSCCKALDITADELKAVIRI